MTSCARRPRSEAAAGAQKLTSPSSSSSSSSAKVEPGSPPSHVLGQRVHHVLGVVSGWPWSGVVVPAARSADVDDALGSSRVAKMRSQTIHTTSSTRPPRSQAIPYPKSPRLPRPSPAPDTRVRKGPSGVLSGVAAGRGGSPTQRRGAGRGPWRKCVIAPHAPLERADRLGAREARHLLIVGRAGPSVYGLLQGHTVNCLENAVERQCRDSCSGTEPTRPAVFGNAGFEGEEQGQQPRKQDGPPRGTG